MRDSRDIADVLQASEMLHMMESSKEEPFSPARSDDALRRRLQYEQLLSRVSLLAIEAGDASVFQEQCVKVMGEALGVSRVYIFEHRHETETMDNTFEWVAADVTPQKEILQGIPARDAPWWMEMLKNDRVINYADIEDIPDEGTKAILRPQGVLSILVVPLFTARQYKGFLGFDECRRKREWPAEDVDLLRAAARIMSGAIAHRRAEMSLRKEHDFSAAVLDALPGVFYCYDENLRFLQWNENLEQVTGYTAEELEGMRPLDLFGGADRDSVSERIREVFEKGESSVEAHFLSKDGTRTPYFFTGRAVELGGQRCLVGVGIDISARIRAEEEKFATLATLEQFVDSVPAFAALVDANERYQLVNRFYEDWFHMPRDRILGQRLADVHRESTYAVMRPYSREALAGKYVRYEHPMTGRDGKCYCFDVQYIPRRTADGSVIGYFTLVFDISTRKKMEEDLRAAHERLRQFVDCNIIGMVVATADGRIIEANDYYLRLTGYSRVELDRGEVDWRQLTPQEWLEADEDAIRQLRERGACDPYEKEYRRRDGTRVPVLVVDALFRGTEEQIAGFVLDLTEQKKAETALKESEERYRMFFESSMDAVLLTVPDGHILAANPAACRMFGRTEEDLKRQGRGAVADISDPRLVPALEERARTGRFMGELNFIRSDGSKFPVEVSTASFHVRDGDLRTSMIVRDITARKEVEQALADEATRRRILVEQSRDGIVVLDQDGKVIEANRKYAEMLGYTPEEVRHLHIWDWDAKWPREKLLEMLRDVSASGDHFETEHRRKNGTWFPVEISSNGAEIGGRKLIFCVCRDITERKESEAKMKKQLSELRQWYSVTLDREERMLELKREVDQLLSRVGEKAKYGIG